MPALDDLDALLPDGGQRAARGRALVAELERPCARSPRPRRSTGAAALLAALVVGTVLVFSGGSSVGPDRVNVVAEARAAVRPGGEIVHVRIRHVAGSYTSRAMLSGADGRVIGRLNGVSERWSTSEPPRERHVLEVQPADGGPPLTDETAYADGVVQRRGPGQRESSVTELDEAATRRRERDLRPDPSDLARVNFQQDPALTLRALLTDGTLREAERGAVDGRDVVHLVGVSPAYVDSGGTRIPPTSYDYAVDADDFTPVEVTTTHVLPARPDDPEPAARRERRLVDRYVFETFERLALDERNAALLRIAPAG